MNESFLPPEISMAKHLRDQVEYIVNSCVNYNHALYQISTIFGEVLYGLKKGLIMGATVQNENYNKYCKEAYKVISENYIIYTQVEQYVHYKIWESLKKN